MSTPSDWPLPPQGIRFVSPAFILSALKRSPLTRDCFPTAMGFYPNARGHRMRRERHDDNLVIYCIAGHGKLRIGGTTHAAGPGSLMLLPQGVAHEYHASNHDPWHLYWVHCRGDSADAFMDYLGYRPGKPVVDVDVHPALSASFDSLLGVRSTGYSMAAFVNAANHLRHLFTQFALAASQRRAAQPGELNLARLQDYMRENIDRRLSLDELATLANLSRFHFANRYKALTGYSPIKHFLHLKMEAACRMLDASRRSVGSIAEELGYTDALYFSRAFKSVVGLSPRDYRESAS
ncbi:MAG: AraC family ligand binding domain-containing protein [Chromatocurvus sp.]